MDDARRQKAIAALQSRGVDKPCPRCGALNFQIVDETTIPVQQQPGTIVIGGPSVPAVIVACTHCGLLTMHSSLLLGLPEESKDAG